jgi:hypothetical protein
MSDCSEYFRSEMHMIAKLISHYQCLRSNKILYEARKVRFQNHKNDCKNQMNQRNLRIVESSNRRIFESSNLRIVENKNKYYSWNHGKMIKNLDFEIEKRIVILIIIFVLASGVIIPNAIIQRRMQNWIQNFQIFVVTLFMILILLDDPMIVFMDITYHIWQQWLFAMWQNPDPDLGPDLGPGSRFWSLFLWFHQLFSKN